MHKSQTWWLSYPGELLLLPLLLGGDSHCEAPPTPAPSGSTSPSPAPPNTSSASILIVVKKVGVGTGGVAMAAEVEWLTVDSSIFIGWSFVLLFELCQLEVESWLARRSFSLKELSRNGKSVSSSLESLCHLLSWLSPPGWFLRGSSFVCSVDQKCKYSMYMNIVLLHNNHGYITKMIVHIPAAASISSCGSGAKIEH